MTNPITPPPEPVAPSEWHLLSFEQPSVNALCEYICHPTNWKVIQGKGKWYEQANPTVSGFTYSHGLFVSNPTQTLWRLAQPEPQPPAAIVEMVNKLHQINNPAIQPVAPTDEEIMELMPQQMRDDLATAARALAGFDRATVKAAAAMRIILNRHAVDHARAVLARWGRPAIQPVPVSERLPGAKDCNAEGRCWFWHPGHKQDDFIDGWILLDPKWAGSRRDSDDSLIYTHWLPHHAIPTPETND